MINNSSLLGNGGNPEEEESHNIEENQYRARFLDEFMMELGGGDHRDSLLQNQQSLVMEPDTNSLFNFNSPQFTAN